jgi:hypothetical protein
MAKTDSGTYPPAEPHGRIEAPFPDFFAVQGSIRVKIGMRINRNMIVLRQGGDLTVVNSVRLSPAGEAELEALGAVRNVVRLGFAHGVDDRYYVDRYGATFWCQEASRHHPVPQPYRKLAEGSALPLENLGLFVFRETRFPESALLLRRHGGVLITCDSLQNWIDWNYCTIPARLAMRFMGFSLNMLVGPLWKKVMTPRGGSLRADFDRLLNLEFEHFISGHGSLCRGNAGQRVRLAVERAFGES